MGLDWATEVLPVLKAVHAAWGRTPTPQGVSQHVGDAEPGREQEDENTSVVLRKLEEADYVRATRSIEEVEGPLFCEPSPKALELLAGWPTERGDTALARLVAVLETQIEAEPDPVKKGKLRKVLEGIQDVGDGVMAGVLTKMIAGGDAN